MINKTWLKAAAIRAIRTVAQAAIAMIGTAAVISEVDWVMVVSAALLAGREKVKIVRVVRLCPGQGRADELFHR